MVFNLDPKLGSLKWDVSGYDRSQFLVVILFYRVGKDKKKAELSEAEFELRM